MAFNTPFWAFSGNAKFNLSQKYLEFIFRLNMAIGTSENVTKIDFK